MKNKFTLICFFLFFSSVVGYSQKSNVPQSIISRTAIIKKYYDKRELVGLPKGQLIELCAERFAVLIKILPYVSLATKPGVTMIDHGIPNSSEYKKTFEVQEESNNNYIVSTSNFQTKILPYSDKDELMKSILFYESILKSLNEFNDL